MRKSDGYHFSQTLKIKQYNDAPFNEENQNWEKNHTITILLANIIKTNFKEKSLTIQAFKYREKK